MIDNKKIINLYRADIKNPGDFFSPPTRYINFNNYKTTYYDFLKLPERNEYACKMLIIGGGGLFGDDKWCEKFNFWLEKIKFDLCIAWGVGIDKNFENNNIFKKFNLIGCRSKNTIFNYVPCASCLHPIFDKFKNISGDKESRISHIKRMIPNSVSTNYNSLENNIEIIANSKKIITTSYHIWYWAKLLNKKVEIYQSKNFQKPLAEKMFTLPSDVTLDNSRKLNLSFARSVSSLLKT